MRSMETWGETLSANPPCSSSPAPLLLPASGADHSHSSPGSRRLSPLSPSRQSSRSRSLCRPFEEPHTSPAAVFNCRGGEIDDGDGRSRSEPLQRRGETGVGGSSPPRSTCHRLRCGVVAVGAGQGGGGVHLLAEVCCSRRLFRASRLRSACHLLLRREVYSPHHTISSNQGHRQCPEGDVGIVIDWEEQEAVSTLTMTGVTLLI